MKELPKRYDHRETEKRWQRHWVERGTYHWKNDAPREQTYVIDTPPPTVSGHLHMGHVFSYVQADIIARYQRMKGMDVFYPMGFDDNGLPTERLVEKSLKKRATDYESREAFIEVCKQISEQARKDFRELFQTLALSVDWRQEYHTISEDCRRLSQQSFLDLHQKGHIERRLEPMLWDTVDQTAIAQAEIVDKELDSHFSDIHFAIEGSDEKIVIATTRPELIPACVAIFYHPEDARYQHLKGKNATTPLFGIKVPILEDDTVEPDKGSGIMMCCTFGDEADIEKWRKHKLNTRVIINQYGKIDLGDTDHPIQGKKVSNADKKHPGARQIILQMLEESGDLIESRPIKHAVKCAERSGAPLEILPTHQWFVKVTDKKEALIERARESNWYPEWMRLRMEQWTEGLNWDWCISRQRYYGVPFPVWYAESHSLDHIIEEQKIIVASADELPINPLAFPPKGYEIISKTDRNSWVCRDANGVEWLISPDADVMDTWATSSISPQINAGGLLEGEHYNKLYPADLRPQAHEIIRTWAFYTVVKSHLHSGCTPWKNLMISGWCLAEDKTKMSKSKGNVVTPVELIEEQGTDAVRYWAATSRLGQDTAYSPDLLKIGKKLVTKLWNATKFAAIHLEKLPEGDLPPVTETLDKWILSRLNKSVKKSTEAFESYEYADALRATEDFFWNDFCDNYLELVKRRVYGNENEDSMSDSALSSSHREAQENEAGDSTRQLSAAATIHECLHGILLLFAPFVPHITEELYSHLFVNAYESMDSLHNRNQWPKAEAYPYDEQAENAGITAVEILEAIRKAKSEKGVSIKYPIDSLTIHTAEDDRLLRGVLDDLAGAGNIASIALSSAPSSDLIKTETDRFALAIDFAEEADVA